MDINTVKKHFREIGENYTAGRAMALSFKPLTIADVSDAYNQAIEDIFSLVNQEMINTQNDREDEAVTMCRNTPEDFFNAIVDESNESGEKNFAIGCPDEEVPILREVAEYINQQDGWNARIEDDIMLVERE